MMMMNKILFWGHFSFIAAAITIGLFFPLTIVIALVILHRIHVVLFDGCIFSHIQHHLGALPKDKNFLQQAAEKLFQKKIALEEVRLIDYALAAVPIFIAILKTPIVI